MTHPRKHARILCLLALPLALASCARRPAPPVAPPAVLPSGWDAGRAVAHGSTQHEADGPRAWPPGATVIRALGQGRFSPWRGLVRSTGQWDLVFRWHGPRRPPAARYTVVVALTSVSTTTGDARGGAACGSFFGPPGCATLTGPCLPFVGGTGMDAGNPAEPLDVPVRTDADGYYLVATTPPVFAEARQAALFQSWGGDVKQQVTWKPPMPTPDRRRHDPNLSTREANRL